MPTGIDLPFEKAELFPSKATISRITKGRKTRWYKGDTINASIGQGYVLLTPIQIAIAAAAVAIDGSKG